MLFRSGVRGLSLVGASGRYSSSPCAGFSFRCFLLLWSMGSRRVGFSSCGSRALERRLSNCGTWAWLLRGMWDLPRPGLKPMSPALAGGFLTTAPPGKSQIDILTILSRLISKHGIPLHLFRRSLMCSQCL